MDMNLHSLRFMATEPERIRTNERKGDDSLTPSRRRNHEVKGSKESLSGHLPQELWAFKRWRTIPNPMEKSSTEMISI